MRQLIVPACVCLAAMSTTLHPGQISSSARLPGETALDQKSSADAMRDLPTGALPDDSVGGSSIREKDPPHDNPELSMFSPDAAASFYGNWDTPPLPPKPRPVVHRSSHEICDTLVEAARTNGVPAPFFIRLLFQESGFRPGVVSSAGAEGIAQFMPETSADVGLDNPFDPVPAIRASARLLRNLAQQFGNLGLAAAAYNAGPKRIADWLAKKSKLPQETQGYVKSITGRPPEKWMVAEAGSPAVKLPRRAPCQNAAGLLAWNGPDRIPLPPVHPQPRKLAPHSVTVAERRTTKAGKHAIHVAASKHRPHKLQLSQR